MLKKIKLFITIISVLMFVVIFSAACGKDEEDSVKAESEFTVTFDVVTSEETTNVLPQIVKKGGYVTQPDVQITSDNNESLKLEGWFEDKDYTVEWDFGLDVVNENITLYAKWVSYSKVNFYLSGSTTPIYSTEVKKGSKVSDCNDILNGYKIKNYYTAPDFSDVFDFSKAITENTDIFIDVEDYIYFDAESIKRSFRAVGAPSGAGSVAGSVIYEKTDDEEYVRANFGYSTARDPYITAEALNIDITKSQKIEITFKNLGGADQLMFYWIVKDENGNYIGSDIYNTEGCMCYTYSTSEMYMDESDDWLKLTFNLAAGEYSESQNNHWYDATYLYTLRIQSLYVSTDSSDTSNELLIKSIKGVYDENYDRSRTKVTFDFGNNISRTLLVDKDSCLSKEIADKKCTGYYVEGYYTDDEFLDPIDIDGYMISDDIVIYVKTGNGFMYDAESLEKAFVPVAATDGNSIVGTQELCQDYVEVNFGYSVIGDPSYSLLKGSLNINGVTKIKIVMKNLGKGNQMALYWVAKKKDGSFTDAEFYTETSSAWYAFKASEMNMDENDDWIEVVFDLSSNTKWTDAMELVDLRLQSVYVSESIEDSSNIFYIKSIEGIFDEDYDKTRKCVTFNFGGQIERKLNIQSGTKISEGKLTEVCGGYIIEGYYSDSDYVNAVDISDFKVLDDLYIYVKTSEGFIYTPETMYKAFVPVAATDGNSKVGSATLCDDYVEVNFGQSVIGDPSYSLLNAQLNISGVKKISIVMKNLGAAPQLALYWTAKKEDGSFVSQVYYTETSSAWYGFKTEEMNMSKDDDWITVTFDLSGNSNWTGAYELVDIRIQSVLASSDNTNVMYFKEIKGTN